MIETAGHSLDLNDPLTLAALIAAGVALLVLILLILALRAARRSARMADPLVRNMNQLAQNVQALSMGQEQLRGGLQTVSDTQANA
ncbi:MAG: DNA recombination protein RmuC, partial [Pseudomonadota bacterium]